MPLVENLWPALGQVSAARGSTGNQDKVSASEARRILDKEAAERVTPFLLFGQCLIRDNQTFFKLSRRPLWMSGEQTIYKADVISHNQAESQTEQA